MSKSSQKTAQMAGIGLGIAAAAAATAAAGYFLYGKDGAKNRKKIKSWGLKAKAEVLEKIENSKHMTKELYDEAVEEVARKYRAIKSVDPKEIEQIAKELKGHWRSIVKHVSGTGRSSKKK